VKFLDRSFNAPYEFLADESSLIDDVRNGGYGDTSSFGDIFYCSGHSELASLTFAQSVAQTFIIAVGPSLVKKKE
jgi:hypothetical protein